MVILDKGCMQTQRLYKQDIELINERIPGKCFADKCHHLLLYFERTAGKFTFELIGEDFIDIIEKVLVKRKNGG